MKIRTHIIGVLIAVALSSTVSASDAKKYCKAGGDVTAMGWIRMEYSSSTLKQVHGSAKGLPICPTPHSPIDPKLDVITVNLRVYYRFTVAVEVKPNYQKVARVMIALN